MGRGNHFELVVHRVVQYDARKYPDEMVSKGQAFQGEFLVLFRRFAQSESVGFGFEFRSGPRSKPLRIQFYNLEINKCLKFSGPKASGV
jgi:hypothetical protein